MSALGTVAEGGGAGGGDGDLDALAPPSEGPGGRRVGRLMTLSTLSGLLTPLESESTSSVSGLKSSRERKGEGCCTITSEPELVGSDARRTTENSAGPAKHSFPLPSHYNNDEQLHICATLFSGPQDLSHSIECPSSSKYSTSIPAIRSASAALTTTFQIY